MSATAATTTVFSSLKKISEQVNQEENVTPVARVKSAYQHCVLPSKKSTSSCSQANLIVAKRKKRTKLIILAGKAHQNWKPPSKLILACHVATFENDAKVTMALHQVGVTTPVQKVHTLADLQNKSPSIPIVPKKTGIHSFTTSGGISCVPSYSTLLPNVSSPSISPVPLVRSLPQSSVTMNTNNNSITMTAAPVNVEIPNDLGGLFDSFRQVFEPSTWSQTMTQLGVTAVISIVAGALRGFIDGLLDHFIENEKERQEIKSIIDGICFGVSVLLVLFIVAGIIAGIIAPPSIPIFLLCLLVGFVGVLIGHEIGYFLATCIASVVKGAFSDDFITSFATVWSNYAKSFKIYQFFSWISSCFATPTPLKVHMKNGCLHPMEGYLYSGVCVICKAKKANVALVHENDSSIGHVCICQTCFTTHKPSQCPVDECKLKLEGPAVLIDEGTPLVSCNNCLFMDICMRCEDEENLQTINTYQETANVAAASFQNANIATVPNQYVFVHCTKHVSKKKHWGKLCKHK